MIQMKLSYILSFIVLTFNTLCYAQNAESARQVMVEALVLDSFSQRPVGRIDFVIKNQNQEPIRKGITVVGPMPVNFGNFIEGKKYTIEIKSPSYKAVSVDFWTEVPKSSSTICLPNILMKLQSGDEASVTTMQEVTVSASKLKFVWKGDTLVYDATIFNLQSGSKLKDLVRQLPGVEIKDNCEVTVFGRRVDCLTLNGKDFFKGDNRVILENLPHFMIKDIKVYERGPALYEEWKSDAGQQRKEYVMDVVLKRDYRRGYLANAEVGAGTSGHWLGRALGSVYSDRIRVGLALNANDISDNNSPKAHAGNWQSIARPKDIMTVAQAKMDANLYGKNNKWHFTSKAILEWNEIESAINSENISGLPSNNITKFTRASGLDKNHKFIFDATYTRSKPNIQIDANIQLGRLGQHTVDSALALNNHNLVNSISNAYKSMNWNQNYRLAIYTGRRLFNNHFLSFRASGIYTSQTQDRFHLYDMTLANQTGEESYRMNSNKNKTKNLQGTIGYNMPFTQARLILFLSLNWKYSDENQNSPLWRLERDSVFFNSFYELGQHPTLSEILMDKGNSQYSDGYQHNLTYNAKLTYRDEGEGYKTEFVLNIPLSTMYENRHITRGHVNVDSTRNDINILPSLSAEIRRRHSNLVWKFAYTPSVDRPTLLELVGYEDTTNPMYILRGNPELKNSYTHLFSSSITYRNKSNWLAYDTRFSLLQDHMMPSKLYNPTTGGYISSITNVDGNWMWDNRIENTTSLSKDNKFQLTNRLGFLWQNMVYLGSDNSIADMQEIAIKRYRLDYDIQLTYRKNEKFDIQPHFNFVLNAGNSNQQSMFDTIARDYIYGINTHWALPYGWNLNTDLNMHQRRGYANGMNTNSFVWNAEITKTWLEGKLQTRLTAYDILNQMHLNTYNISAEGYTSSWRRGLTRYVLLSLYYNFEMKPRKSK